MIRRRAILTALALSGSILGAIGACSTFSSGGGDESPDAADDAVPDVVAIPEASPPVDAEPPIACPLVPTAAPCASACEETLPTLPAPTSGANVVDARIAVRGGIVYVARVVDSSSVELLSYDGTGWTFRGSFPAHAVYGIGANDTTILLSLEQPLVDGGTSTQQILELDVTCQAPCAGTGTYTAAGRAGRGVVTIGQRMYFSTSSKLATSLNGKVELVADEFGGPNVAADCAYVYYSNPLDQNMHRFEDATRISQVITNGVGYFDASVFDGAFPGSVTLGTSDDAVFASTGSGQLWSMPKTPLHDATPIVDGGASSFVAADNRFVYYARVRGFLLWDLVRVQPDGGGALPLSANKFAMGDLVADADHVYIVNTSGVVTRFKK